jgi:hypothetical protein
MTGTLMLKKSILLLMITSLMILSACDNSVQTQNNITAKSPIDIENVSWLRNKLPEKTLAYMRIPTLWNLFFEGNADSLYSALSHSNNKAEVEKLQQSLLDTYLSKIPDAYKTHFKLIIKSIETPLEIAITNAVDDSMIPNLLVGTTLKDFNREDLQALIDSLVTETQNMVRVLSPLSDDGKASLMAQMIPIYLNYDLASGKLAVLAGPTASQKTLDGLLSQTQAHDSLKNIMDFENSVDQSGKNHEAWVNVKALYQQNKAMIPPPQRTMMEQMGLADMEFVWMGTAQHSGKGEFIFHIQMPDSGLRNFLPRVDEEFDIQTAGTPDLAFVLTLPTVEQISQAYAFIKSVNPEIKAQEQIVKEGLSKINDAIGMDIADFLNAYGQQVFIVKDESGLWFAQKVVNKQLSEEIFNLFHKKLQGQTQSKSLAGVSIDETSFSLMEFFKQFAPDDPAFTDSKEITDIFYGKQKIYTQNENGYILWAAVPQILADRGNSQNKQSLKTFLQEDLQLNWNQAFLAWATESEYVSRNAYHTYLEVISFMANVANTDVDLFNFPTAQDLNLPTIGRFGLSLNSSPDFLSLRVSYEHSLLESFSGPNGMFAVAITGILAAVAIPAYRDYTVRAKVMGKMNQVSSVKMHVSELIMREENYPTSEAIINKFGESDNYLYDEETGSITLLFNFPNESSLKGKYLSLNPNMNEDGYLEWSCESDISTSQLPPSCR